MPDYTVFVLGAGASQPYGLPLGRTLVEALVSGAHVVLGSAARRYFTKETADQYEETVLRDIEVFATELAASGMYSIDRFAQLRPQYVNIAKVQIANILMPLETRAVVSRRVLQDWHGWFVNNILMSFPDPESMPIKFISFNYDRLFEYALMSHLVTGRGMSSDDAIAIVNRLDVVHVYGTLDRECGWDPDNHCVYLEESDDAVLRASEGIRLIPEQRDSDDGALQSAQALMSGAKSVVFLGFGFDSLNCDRLGLGEDSAFWNLPHKRRIWATAVDLWGRERLAVERILKPSKSALQIGTPNERCELFLRTYLDLASLG